MIELRFHHELYDGFAVDEAIKVYAPYAAFALEREPEGYRVRVTASSGTLARGIDEATLSAELANFALGLTIERQLAGDQAAGDQAAGDQGAAPSEVAP